MVRIIYFAILTLFPLFSDASNSLQLVVDTTNIESGKPIHAVIIANNIKSKLSSISLDDLKQDFGMEIIESANKLEGKQSIQELKINLYPRGLGLVVIPAITLGNYRSQAIELVVTPAKTTSGIIKLETNINLNVAWQRQQIIMTTTVISPSKFARLEVDNFEQSSIETYIIASTKEKLSNGYYRLTIGWIIYPLIAGKQKLISPAVNYRLNGKIQRKFFPITKIVNVKKLPSYIPPLMPVGTLDIDSSISSNYIWHVTLSSQDISPNTLLSLAIPFKKITNIDFKNIIITSKNDASSTHKIPLKFNSSTIMTLPEIIFKTFNPITGKIDTQQTPEKNIIYLSLWVKLMLALIGIFVIYKTVLISFNYTKKVIHRRKSILIIINSSLDAKSPQELRSILNKYFEIKQWGRNLPLNQWCLVWSFYKKSSAEKIINELSNACYAKKSQSVSQTTLNQKIYNLLS